MQKRTGPYFIDAVPRAVIFLIQALLPLIGIAVVGKVFGGTLFSFLGSKGGGNFKFDFNTIGGFTFLSSGETFGEKAWSAFLAIALVAGVLIFIYQFIANVLDLPSVPGMKILERVEGYFIIRNDGNLALWPVRARRSLLTYGIFYFTIFSLIKAPDSMIFKVLGIAGCLYLVTDLLFMDAHKRLRSLHDWLNGTWKVKLDSADSKTIRKGSPYPLQTIRKYDQFLDKLVD